MAVTHSEVEARRPAGKLGVRPIAGRGKKETAPPVAFNTPSSVVIRQLFIAGEIAAVFLSGLLAKFLCIDIYLAPEPIDRYLAPLLTGSLLVYLAFCRRELYAPAAVQSVPRAAGTIATSLVLAFLMLTGLGYLFHVAGEYSRFWLLIWVSLSFLTILSGRVLMQGLVGFLAKAGAFRTKVAVYGEGESLSRALEEFALSRPDIEVVGTFGPHLNILGHRKGSASGGLAELMAFARDHATEQILIVPSLLIRKQLPQLVGELSALPCDVELLAQELESGVFPLDVALRGNHVMVGLRRRPIAGWNAALKNAEDKILGLLALVLVAPILTVIAIAIKLDSKGPVFFRQRRHGFNHKVFAVWKFRTMNVLEDGPSMAQAQINDPRVTRVGKLLRKTSLDELPQLINVILGDMSLVGPRPHALAHNDSYGAIVEQYASRHIVKPGITGWAQINGLRGPTNDPELMRQRVEHDLYYIQHWSIWLDLKILALTPFLGFLNKNAL